MPDDHIIDYDPAPAATNPDACDKSFDIADKNTADEDIAALQLFADVDFTDPEAVAKRETEWRELFA